VTPFPAAFSFPSNDGFFAASPPRLETTNNSFFADPFGQTAAPPPEGGQAEGFTFSADGSTSADFTFASANFAAFSDTPLPAFVDPVESEYREFAELIENPAFTQTPLDPAGWFDSTDPTDNLESALGLLRK
jgi:hypothetical protein